MTEPAFLAAIRESYDTVAAAVALVRAHEYRHVADMEATLRKYTCLALGRTEDEAKALIGERMDRCDILPAAAVLDGREGKLVPHYTPAGVLDDMLAVPRAVPPPPTDC
jgi:hypothetical protein